MPTSQMLIPVDDAPVSVEVDRSVTGTWFTIKAGRDTVAVLIPLSCTVANVMAARDALKACFAPAPAVREVA